MRNLLAVADGNKNVADGKLASADGNIAGVAGNKKQWQVMKKCVARPDKSIALSQERFG